MIRILTAAIAGYLIGSIPSGMVFSKLFGRGDIRKQGSGNIGATNALRTQGKLVGALTLLFDLGKGSLGYFIAQILIPFEADTIIISEFQAVGSVFPVLGHIFPVWLGFRGGKGVASALGVIVAACPWLGMACFVVWLGSFFVFRISSIAGMLSVLSAPTVLICSEDCGQKKLLLPYLFTSALVLYRHKNNISGILSGTEKKLTK
ncbi:MAG: glycerol-3-phosphate 1-O-acyltransferase PlsY [Holosporales bacterium]|nr:glycerol-3-phosphate 1-O-acyltransferase PlsY [Holosporales bacterium]